MKSMARDPNESWNPSWFPVFGPIVAWGLHLLVSAAMTVYGCRGHSPALARGVVLGTGLAALVLAAGGIVKAWQLLRRTRSDVAGAVEGRTPDTIIPLTGLLCSIAFGVAVLLESLPAILLRGLCETGR